MSTTSTRTRTGAHFTAASTPTELAGHRRARGHARALSRPRDDPLTSDHPASTGP